MTEKRVARGRKRETRIAIEIERDREFERGGKR